MYLHELVKLREALEQSGCVVQENNELLRQLLATLKSHNRVVGGVITQIGDCMSTGSLIPIAVGNSPVFQVTPQWATPPADGVTTKLAQAAVSSSNPTDFPVALDTTDETGTTFILGPLPSQDTVGEGDTISWVYTNADGTTATVSGTVTIVNGVVSITDDVTGGTFTQIK